MPLVDCNRGDLWVHASYAGGGKSTFAMNVAYDSAVYGKTNSLYVSLEQPYPSIMSKFYAIHSTTLARQENRDPLEYCKIRDGGRTSDEEAFYQRVVSDFNSNSEYGQVLLWFPEERDVTMRDIRSRAELAHRERGIGLVVIDLGDLVDAEVGLNYRDARNSVVSDAKELASQLNEGQGVAVLFLTHVTREGWDFAEANEGIYLLPAICPHEAIEAEANHITATFLDEELREKGLLRFSNIGNPVNGPTDLRTNLQCRRIDSLPRVGEVRCGEFVCDRPLLALSID